MTDLASWLLEQIAEDERPARRALVGWHQGALDSALSEPYSEDTQNAGRLLIEPERVLAECQAKRAVIDEHKHWGEGDTRYCMTCHDRMEYGWCRTVRALALPYADRPGYDETWRL